MLEIVGSLSSSSSLEIAIENSFKNLKIPSNHWKRLEIFHFPKGFQDLIENFNQIINSRLKKKKTKRIINMGVSEKVYFFVKSRIEITQEYKESMRKIIVYMINPKNLFFSNKLLFKIADEIWYLTDDNSLDFNFYSKRFLLMKIYFLTFVFWLRDNNSENQRTFSFLDRQIKNVSNIGKYKFLLKGFFKKKSN